LTTRCRRRTRVCKLRRRGTSGTSIAASAGRTITFTGGLRLRRPKRWDYEGNEARKPRSGSVPSPRNDTRTFVIQNDAVVERVNSDRVTFAPPPRDAPPPEPHAPTEADLDKNVEGPTYVVDKVLAHRVAGTGGLEFRIKWVDYADHTWEPRRNVPQELLSRYFARARRQDARKQAGQKAKS